MRRLLLLLLVATAAVTATADVPKETVETVRALLPRSSGLQISTVGDAVVLSGQVDSYAEMSQIIAVVEGLSSLSLHNLVMLSPLGQKDLTERIAAQLSGRRIEVRLLNNHLFLEGVAANDFEADRAVEIAKTFIIAPIRPLPPREPQKEKERAPAAATKFGGRPPDDDYPKAYNRNGLPTTVVDMVRVERTSAKERRKGGR